MARNQRNTFDPDLKCALARFRKAQLLARTHPRSEVSLTHKENMSRAAIETESAIEAASAPEQQSSILTASLPGACLAEYVGTYILILVGDGAVAAAVLAGSIDGWGVAVLWGLAVTFAIYVASPVSGAHFNPAVTLAMAVFRGFPPSRIIPYIVSQIAGAFTGAACVYALWHGFWPRTLEKFGVEVGAAGSQRLMMI